MPKNKLSVTPSDRSATARREEITLIGVTYTVIGTYSQAAKEDAVEKIRRLILKEIDEGYVKN
jgi:hypothetical protein